MNKTTKHSYAKTISFTKTDKLYEIFSGLILYINVFIGKWPRKEILSKKLLLGTIFPLWRRERQRYEVIEDKFKNTPKSIKILLSDIPFPTFQYDFTDMEQKFLSTLLFCLDFYIQKNKTYPSAPNTDFKSNHKTST